MRRFIVLSCLLITFGGCPGRRGGTVLNPIQKSDIFVVEEGSEVKAPDGKVTVVEKDGCFLSDLWMEKVGKARVQW